MCLLHHQCLLRPSITAPVCARWDTGGKSSSASAGLVHLCAPSSNVGRCLLRFIEDCIIGLYNTNLRCAAIISSAVWFHAYRLEDQKQSRSGARFKKPCGGCCVEFVWCRVAKLRNKADTITYRALEACAANHAQRPLCIFFSLSLAPLAPVHEGF